MTVDPPPALAWHVYADAVKQELDSLLKLPVCDEQEYQRLIERHPCLLPWCYGTFGGGHHGLVHGAVVRQPRLTGLNGKQPDFLMITRDSASVYVVLIEIESPCKHRFTKQGNPNAELTQAISQLRSWKAWFELPGKSDSFVQEYQVPYGFRERRVEQRYVLIYGRRDELLSSGFAYLRSQHQAADERFMSYDHLEPDQNFSNAITVRVTGDGYEAVSVPPTLELGPFYALDFAMIQSKEEALATSSMMAPERAAFLRRRLSYWDTWASDEDRGMLSFEVE